MNRAQRMRRFRQLDREQNRYEESWSTKITALLNKQVRDVIRSIKRDGPDVTFTLLSQIVNETDLYMLLRKMYGDIGVAASNSELYFIREVYGDEMKAQKAWNPFGFNSIWRDLMNTYFDLIGALKVTNITELTRRRIQRIMMDSKNENLDITAQAERLARLDPINLRRGRLIARTEGGIAASKGQDNAARRSGVKMVKVWLSARDKRTRRVPADRTDHYHMNDRTAEMDQHFQVIRAGGFDLMMHPHSYEGPADQVCNCRCKVIYEAARDPVTGRLILTQYATGL